MKKLLLGLLIVALLLAACGGDDEEEPTEAPKVEPTEAPAATAVPEPEEEDEFQVGMISDVGGVDDASFNQTTWEGLERAGNEIEGVTAQFLESQAQADYENNITEFAEQGYDMIVTVGFLLGDATAKMAVEYPEVMFGIIDFAYDPPIPNVQGIVFNTDEAAFMAGYLAAGMAVQLDPDDPQIGWVGGMQIPPVEIFIVAYEAGMAYYNDQKGASVTAAGTYVGNFEAPDDGKAAGNSLLDEGVDIIFGVGGKTGNGGLIAIREASEAGQAVAGIGVDVDQYYTLPNEKGILLTSVEKKLDNAVFGSVSDAVEGNFGGGGVYVGTLTNDGVGLAPYHDWEDQIPDDLKAEVEALRPQIIAGSLSTGWPPGEEEPVEVAEFQVGMISDVGGVDDASFNQTTWEGLDRADNEIEGVAAQFLESQAQADYENNITEFAEQGYDMIVTVGFLLGDATAKMAVEYPDVKFAIIDFAYDPPIPNVQGIVFNTDEAAFMAGYLAAGMAVQLDPDDPQIGWVGGMQIPPVEIFIVAYEAGMAYYNDQKGASVTAAGTYVGNFEAPDDGKAAGNSLLDEGVDIIFGVGGKTGNGGLIAIREASEAGQAVAGIGVDVDQYYTLPNEKGILLTSVEKKLDNAVFSSVSDAVEGNFGGGGVYVGMLTNDGVGLAPYHDWDDQIPDDLKAEVEALRPQIIDGTVSTGWPPGAEEPEVEAPEGCNEDLTGETIVFYSQAGLTGALSTILGTSFVNALNDSIADLNAAGGICGAMVELDLVDTQYEAEQEIAAYEINREKDPPPLAIATYGSAASIALAPRVNEDHITNFAAGLNAQAFYVPRNGYTVGVAPIYSDQFAGFAQWLQENWDDIKPDGAGDDIVIGVVGWEGPFGAGATTPEALAYVEGELGITVLELETAAVSAEADYVTPLQSLAVQGANAIYVQNLGFGTAQAIGTLHAMGMWESFVVGGCNWSINQDILTVLGDSAPAMIGYYGVFPWNWWNDTDLPGVQQALAAFERGGYPDADKGVSYLTSYAGMFAFAEIATHAINTVGYENLNSTTFFEAFQDLGTVSALGIFEYDVRGENRSPRQAQIRQTQLVDGNIEFVVVQDFFELPDTRPAE